MAEASDISVLTATATFSSTLGKQIHPLLSFSVSPKDPLSSSRFHTHALRPPEFLGQSTKTYSDVLISLHPPQIPHVFLVLPRQPNNALLLRIHAAIAPRLVCDVLRVWDADGGLGLRDGDGVAFGFGFVGVVIRFDEFEDEWDGVVEEVFEEMIGMKGDGTHPEAICAPII